MTSLHLIIIQQKIQENYVSIKHSPCSWAIFKKCAIGFRLAGIAGKLAILNTQLFNTQTKSKMRSLRKYHTSMFIMIFNGITV